MPGLGLACLVRGQRGLLAGAVVGEVVVAGFHHSGGSSSNTRVQIALAILVVATVASAPSPASRPAHISRLATSFCISAGMLARTTRIRSLHAPPAPRGRRRSPRRR